MLPLPVVQLPEKFSPVEFLERNVRLGVLNKEGERVKGIRGKFMNWVSGVFRK